MFSKSCVFIVTLTAAAVAMTNVAIADEPLIPSAEGTTWHYVKVEQAEGAAPDEARALTVRIAGKHSWEGKQLLSFETLNGDEVSKTELLDVTDHGILCYARGTRDELLTKVDPPEIFVPADLKLGSSWETDGMANDMRLHQHFTIAAEEDVYVPAGKFHAFRFHSDENGLMAVSVDRWFVRGIGFVKDVTTMRGPGGALLQRTTIELQKRPEIVPLPATPSPSAMPSPILTLAPMPSATSPMPSPESSTPSDGKHLIADVSDDPAGGMKTEFHSDVQNIYVRWHGHDLPKDARVRIAWIAEDVGGIVDPNFIVDETETAAPAPDASARFTLGRPQDGWAEGKYRLEFYVNDQLEQTINVRIVK